MSGLLSVTRMVVEKCVCWHTSEMWSGWKAHCPPALKEGAVRVRLASQGRGHGLLGELLGQHRHKCILKLHVVGWPDARRQPLHSAWRTVMIMQPGPSRALPGCRACTKHFEQMTSPFPLPGHYSQPCPLMRKQRHQELK